MFMKINIYIYICMYVYIHMKVCSWTSHSKHRYNRYTSTHTYIQTDTCHVCPTQIASEKAQHTAHADTIGTHALRTHTHTHTYLSCLSYTNSDWESTAHSTCGYNRHTRTTHTHTRRYLSCLSYRIQDNKTPNICVCVREYVYVCVHICMCACICVCMREYVYVCVHMCMCACICVCVRV
jgi:hypothetical protein